ncbi:MAG: hypothetical protein VZR25_03490 [Acutalibacteraceae bacterium]|nr:hypothetical protein [Acutalibacteraceae bacterium]NLD28831.1 hypothetical protein [Clostridiales bacterium]
MSITVLTLTNRTPAPERDVFLKGFLALPKALYPRERRTQDTKAERAILNGTHPLSGEFTVRAYLAVDDGASPQGRCVLTYYPDDPAAYVGFFECVEDLDVCRALLSAAEAQARADGKEKLVGPLNASFWIGYRFKVENFDEHFTGEPDNLPYYADFWEACGFTVSERYYSNYLRSPTPEDPSEKWEKRLQRALDKGYEIRSLERGKFDEALRDIYRMLVRLYAKFPAFKLISEEQFTALFGSLKYVVDYECVLLGYKDGELAGFFVCVPNYGTLVDGDLSLRDLPAILRIRRNCKEYVILYIGVDRKHLGLGGAFAQTIRQIGQNKGAGSIAALIHEGNSSGVFFRELTTHTARYVLLEKAL